MQALNRLTFGARPGDVEQVKAMGLKKWIDLQLHPDRIPENPVLLEKLKPFDTLSMPGEELVRNYPAPQIVRQMVAGQIPVPQRSGPPPADSENGRSAPKRNRATTPPRLPTRPIQQVLAALLTPGEIRSPAHRHAAGTAGGLSKPCRAINRTR